VLSNLPRRREEARRKKYCLNKSNLVCVEETEDKKCSDKKASEVIKVVFEKCDESSYVSV
jgi:hypothetical protein